MVRKLALSLAIASAIAAGQAKALGLGEIRVNSALNEPLDADIRLVQVRDLSAQQILPRMADVEEFSLAGLTKSRFLSDVKFQVKVSPDGSGTIHVTSAVPIQEPFLSFLMEVNWPQGRLVREYTLLLDPPVFDPAPVTTAINAPSVAAPAKAGSSGAPGGETAPKKSNIQTNLAAQEIFVNNNDTLYLLAKNNRPAADISIEQMMIAMQRKNPDIFPTANINLMRAGKVMQLPSADEARALTRKQAIAEAARQTADWKAGRRSASTQPSEPKAADAAQSDASSGGVASGAPNAAEDQLKIVSAPKAEPEQAISSESAPEQAPATARAESGEAAEVSSAQESAQESAPEVEAEPSSRELELIQRNQDLENRLLVTQESVDKVSRENAELGEKLDSIQEQLVAMQRLMELKDQQMAALQAEMLKQVQEANKPKPSAIDELINFLMANPLYLGGIGGLLILLLALAALARRRRTQDYDDEPAPRKKKGSKGSKQEVSEQDEVLDFAEQPSSAAPLTAAATAGAAMAAVSSEPAQALDDDELDDLDLDMDLDLDLEQEADNPFAEVGDLTTDAVPDVAATEIDSVLDEILNDETSVAPSEADDLDALLDSEAEFDADLDELLEDDDLPTSNNEESLEDDDELEGLEFAVSGSLDGDGSDDSTDSLLDDELFEEEIEPESDQVETSASVDESELLDEPLELDKPEVSAIEPLEEDGDLSEFVDDDLDRMLMEDASSLADDESGEVRANAEPSQTAESDTDELMLDDNLLAQDETALELESAAGLDQMVSATDDDLEDDLLELGDFDSSLSLDDEPADATTGAELVKELDFELAEPDADEPEAEAETESDLEPELDELLASASDEAALGEPERPKKPGELVEDELTANIAHDLDMSLEDELDEMLAEDLGDIELIEEGDDADLDEDNLLDSLEGADEVETKLDLARAYIEMDDTEGARDILSEIKRDGNSQQQAEAQSLLDKLS